MGFEPRIAFSVEDLEPRGLEILVNFGVFAGREATAAEIDDLAQELVPEAGELSIVAERRHEFDERSEAELHQVRICVPVQALPAEEDLDRLRELVVSRAEHWARQCVERRHAEIWD
ncbi:MAG: hypothetical protein C5B48_15115 [Candidatus Rokuibacteriota bacterium]|nr:MAG: hypothetical protein C5B48_15115 [Candidatus Rokubacteria bacterium]